MVGRVYIRLAVHLNALPCKDLGSPASGAVGGFKNAQDDCQGDELCGDRMDDRGLFRPRFPVRCISSMGSDISSVHRRSKSLQSFLGRLLTLLKLSFWIGIAPVDILTELSMIALSTLLMVPVQVAFSKKLVIVVAFIFRIL